MRTATSVIGVLFVTAALSGCSGTSTTHKTSASPFPAATAGAPAVSTPRAYTHSSAGSATTSSTVSIQGFAFTPAVLTVKSGTTVTVTNRDSATHTWTATHNTFDSGALPTGKTFTFTFTKPGTYSYVCSIHPSMQGTVTVTS